MDDDYEEEVKVLENVRETEGGGVRAGKTSESKMREVCGRVRVCWDLWGRVARESTGRKMGDGEEQGG